MPLPVCAVFQIIPPVICLSLVVFALVTTIR